MAIWSSFFFLAGYRGFISCTFTQRVFSHLDNVARNVVPQSHTRVVIAEGNTKNRKRPLVLNFRTFEGQRRTKKISRI